MPLAICFAERINEHSAGPYSLGGRGHYPNLSPKLYIEVLYIVLFNRFSIDICEIVSQLISAKYTQHRYVTSRDSALVVRQIETFEILSQVRALV